MTNAIARYTGGTVDRPRTVEGKARVISSEQTPSRAIETPKPKQTTAPATVVYTRPYRTRAGKIRAATGRVAEATPGTDTFGTVFKMLSVAGLIGLGVFRPESVNYALSRSVAVIRLVIGGVSK